MCMIDGGDGPRVWSESNPIARRDHVCGECGRTILKGEPYWRYSGISCDGDAYGGKTCEHCHVLADWLGAQCGGYIYGRVIEDIQEHAHDYARDDLQSLSDLAKLQWMVFGKGLRVPATPSPLTVRGE